MNLHRQAAATLHNSSGTRSFRPLLQRLQPLDGRSQDRGARNHWASVHLEPLAADPISLSLLRKPRGKPRPAPPAVAPLARSNAGKRPAAPEPQEHPSGGPTCPRKTWPTTVLPRLVPLAAPDLASVACGGADRRLSSGRLSTSENHRSWSPSGASRPRNPFSLPTSPCRALSVAPRLSSFAPGYVRLTGLAASQRSTRPPRSCLTPLAYLRNDYQPPSNTVTPAARGSYSTFYCSLPRWSAFAPRTGLGNFTLHSPILARTLPGPRARNLSASFKAWGCNGWSSPMGPAAIPCVG